MGETVKYEDLVEREGLYYKKYTDVPFTGKVTEGTFKDGLPVGPWVIYYDNGQLSSKGTYKKGKEDGSWVVYCENGQLFFRRTST